MKYDFRSDIRQLQVDLDELYGDLADEIEGVTEPTDSDDENDREKQYKALSKTVENIERIKVKANDDVDPAYVNEYGKPASRLPFAVAFGALLMSSEAASYRKAVQTVYDRLRTSTDERFHELRVKTKGMNDIDAMVRFARKHEGSVPDKKPLTDKPFKLTIPIGIDETFDRRFSSFNCRAERYLAGKDFKIKTTEITANLKASLQQALSAGYASGETGKQLAARIRALLGPNSNAETIAITEIAGASNFGQNEFAKEYGERYAVQMWKTWVQIERANKRVTHAAVAGETLKQEEDFDVDGEEMSGPHCAGASARNTVRCGCGLDWDEGESVPAGKREDGRGVSGLLNQVGPGAEEEDVPYVAAERVGAFVNDVDATEYMGEIYGVDVDEAFAMSQLNEMADQFDAFPEIALKNLQLTEVDALGIGADYVAGYSHTDKWIKFYDPTELDDREFAEVFTHEYAHSLHYAEPKLFEQFAELGWDRVGKGDIFGIDAWEPKYADMFMSPNANVNAKEHFAEAVSWYVNRNRDFRQLARVLKKERPDFQAAIDLFDKFFGSVKP